MKPVKEKIIYDECPICFKTIKEKDFVVTKCGHKFCSKCIFTNFSKSQNGNCCPMCRTTFAPSFVKSNKFNDQQLVDKAEEVIIKFQRLDKSLFKNKQKQQERKNHIENDYQNYIIENGFQNVPYLKLMDQIRHICRRSDLNYIKTLELFYDAIALSITPVLAEKLDIRH